MNSKFTFIVSWVSWGKISCEGLLRGGVGVGSKSLLKPLYLDDNTKLDSQILRTVLLIDYLSTYKISTVKTPTLYFNNRRDGACKNPNGRFYSAARFDTP